MPEGRCIPGIRSSPVTEPSTPHPGRGGALSTAQPSIAGFEAVRGDGSWIEAADGRRYLDMAAGIATCNLGHSHPAVLAAVTDQMARLIHLGGVCGHAPQRNLAERLADITPTRIERFLFSTTGSEANEAALRLARGATGRPGAVCFRGSFHGRTQGALAATTSKAAFRLGLGAGNVHVAPFPRPEDLGVSADEAAEHALRELDLLHRHQLSPEETACYMIEPVQGHGGCHPAGRAFLEGLRERADAYGALLVFDEIQTGFGRTGDWFASGTYGVEPDLMTMAKAIGAGFPLSGNWRARGCDGLGGAGRPRIDLRRKPRLVRGRPRGDRRNGGRGASQACSFAWRTRDHSFECVLHGLPGAARARLGADDRSRGPRR